jgi:hypothetical protein
LRPNNKITAPIKAPTIGTENCITKPAVAARVLTRNDFVLYLLLGRPPSTTAAAITPLG